VHTLPIQARMLYLPTYEATRARLRSELKLTFADTLPDTAIATISNGIGGAVGSVASSAVVVPMDVVSSRLMVHHAHGDSGSNASVRGMASEPSGRPAQGSGAGMVARAPADGKSGSRGMHVLHAWRPTRDAAACALGAGTEAMSGVRRVGNVPAGAGGDLVRIGGIGMAQHILATEGVAGLYRGLGMSLLTYAPSSAVWWGAYATYQDWNWRLLYHNGFNVANDDIVAIAAVQAVSGCMSGLTAGVLTTPLDVIKTQLQVAGRSPVTAGFSTLDVIQRLYAREGIRGFWRGFVPRMANVALWGTCMVSAYEFLKRTCIMQPPPGPPE
jgi:hypothetical protein